MVAIGTVVAGAFSSNEVCAAEKTSFAEEVFPIFKARCTSCHQPGGAGFEKSGLDLSTYEGAMKGTKFGKMIIPGDPESSNLMLLLDWRAAPALRMPHGKKKLMEPRIAGRDFVVASEGTMRPKERRDSR